MEWLPFAWEASSSSFFELEDGRSAVGGAKKEKENTHCTALTRTQLKTTQIKHTHIKIKIKPSFAREIMECLATAVVVASTDKQLASDLADVLSSPTFRVFTSSDVTGVEVGGSVKNVIAISSGICEGLNLGMNAQASLVTRGCAEMRR